MKSFFSRYFTAHLLILVCSLLLVALFSIFSMKDFLFSDNQTRQLDFTRTVAAMIEATELEEGNEAAYVDVIGEDSDFRITLIDPDGTVLGDNAADWRYMDNHSNRPEVIQALAYGEGQSRRLSATLRESLLYTAVLAKEGDLIVRVSMVVGNIDRMVVSLAFRVGLLTLVILLLALSVSFRQTNSINRMLKSIGAVVTDYAGGDFHQNLYLGGFKEAVEVGEAVNSMGRQLKEKIESVTFQKNKSEAMLRNMVEPVIYLDSNLIINDINQAALKMSGLSFKSCLGKNLLQIIGNIDLCQLAEICLEEDAPKTEIINFEARHYMVQATTIPSAEEQGRSILLVMNDVTDIKQMELMRKDFVANVSHELRTPITSIIGFVETLRMMPEPRTEQQEKFLKIIQSQSQRLGEIVNDLLTLASLEESKGILERDDFLLADMVREAESVCQIKADERNIRFVHDFDPASTLYCHRNLTEQALVNYLDNAVKYGPNDSEIVIKCEGDGAYHMLSVTDKGPGIPLEQQGRLFERFFRVDKARSREIGGTGLGLSIVKHIAIKHGGRAGVENEPGRGSRFFLTFSDKKQVH